MKQWMEHAKFGFCGWDILAGIIFIGTVIFLVNTIKKGKEIRDLEENTMDEEIF